MKAAPPLDTRALDALAPVLQEEIRKRLSQPRQGAVSPSAAILRQIFFDLCDETCTQEDQVRFLIYSSSLARQAMLDRVSSGNAIGATNTSVLAFDQWFRRLGAFDPLCTRMVELYYIAGLNSRQTAAALQVPHQTVIRGLRFAKAWWTQAQLRGNP